MRWRKGCVIIGMSLEFLWEEVMKNCIVVDDDETNRVVAAEMAESLGLRVSHEFECAKEALPYVLAGEVDVILLDWHMPEMDGIEFLEHLRTTKEGQKVAVLMYSAMEEQGGIAKAMNSQADGFIPKPITFNKMSEQLRVAGIL